MEDRVLILAPHERDAAGMSAVVEAHGLRSHVCTAGAVLLEALMRGAATAILTEEALGGGFDRALGAWLGAQPAWSDFPFVVLANPQSGRRSDEALAALRRLGNLVLLERPLNAETLGSAAASAVRARRRQYANRRLLADIEASKRAVDQLNADLESRIAGRTADLAQANDRLMREINERERVQASVVHGQKMEAIGRLTGGIAHDFNNLLHVVSLNLELIQRAELGGRLADCARRAKEAVSRGARLTAQLLSFARERSLAPKLLDVSAAIGELRELVEVSAGHRITLAIELGDEPLYAMLDRPQLEMAVLNLAINARDGMPDGGRLTIRAEAVELPDAGDAVAGDGIPPPLRRWAQVSVQDEGVGIAPHLLAKVFDPFFTTKPDGRGTGLGLSQVYGFARQSEGSAEIRSTLGSGTTVLLRFPRVDAGTRERLAGQIVPQAVDPEHEVLVIEDDANVRQGIVDGLRLLNYRVREAADGESGLHELRRRRPSLLLVDYLMPGMNGAQVIAEVRRDHPGLPILLATGYADMTQVEQVIERRAVLTKPFDLETLAAAVAGELRRAAVVSVPASATMPARDLR